ncbi:nucleotide disphospho-sugar-binding domain-containing protein [Actinophytocola sp.]|uniref:nucleotide disphospho-sugar-binding domain-containing protein n=1 Tax=Actinophytocola sp. TaxID=1872138 RepID=UPI00389A349E
MRSVIVAAPPVFGETVPVLRVAEGLVRRGHAVTALVGSRFAERAEDIGARFVPLHGAADFDDRRLMSDNPERFALPTGPEQYNWDLINVFVAGMNAQHEALQRLLEEDPDAALVANSLCTGMWPVALGAPGRRPRRWVAVVTNPIACDDDATTPMGPIPGLSGDEAVRAHRAANAEWHAVLEPTRQAAQLRLTELGAPEPMPPFYQALYSLPDALAALTVPEFDFPRANPLGNLTYAGILPAPPGGDPGKPAWWDDLDSDRPVVAVTQGTIANGDLGQLVEPALRALADQDVLVVAALGRDPSVLVGPVPANARVAKYVPFDELLPRVDLLVTNGGAGGTQLALAAGVPVVACGATEEKPMTAARVAHHRVGVDLATATPSEAQITEAVTTVLGDPTYRQAAGRLREAYAAYDPITTVEALLR